MIISFRSGYSERELKIIWTAFQKLLNINITEKVN